MRSNAEPAIETTPPAPRSGQRSGRLRAPTPLAAIAAAVALVAAACGGSTSSDIVAPAEPDEIPRPTTTAAPDGDGDRPGRSVETVDLSAVQTELDQDGLTEIIDLYLSYLWLSDETAVTAPSDDLAAIVSDDLLGELADANVENRALLDAGDLFGAEWRVSYAHPTRVDGVFEAATIVDCVEVEEQNVLAQVTTRFVTQTVDIELVGGQLQVLSVDVSNDGRTDTGPGCLPAYHLNRAEETATQYLAAVADARADPTEVLPETVLAVTDEPLQGEVAKAIADQATIGVALATPEEHRVEAIGRDTQRLGLVVAVATCTFLPAGRAFTSLADGEAIELGAELAPGTAIAANVFVRLGPVAGSDRVFAFSDARTESPCWEEGS